VAYLLITVEGKPPTRRALDGPAIVGRAIDSEVWLDDNRLSRQHGRFEPATDGSPNAWSVIDLNSKNGTQIMGSLIKVPSALRDGDEIEFGHVKGWFIVEAGEDPPTTTGLR